MKRSIAIGFALAIVTHASAASAYRPFDGTDADVAEHGEFELELGPSQYLHVDHQAFLEAPSTVLNYGIFPGWELVADLRNQVPLQAGHIALVDSDLLLKAVLREGVLQGKTGVSIATEFGVLFPFVGTSQVTSGQRDFGLVDNVIVSYRVPWATAHLNSQIAFDRAERIDGFESLILEGPWTWTVRPVMEAELEKEFASGGPSTRSILGGAILNVSDSLHLDGGLRAFHDDAFAQASNGFEVRIGLTWSIPIVEYEMGEPQALPRR